MTSSSSSLLKIMRNGSTIEYKPVFTDENIKIYSVSGTYNIKEISGILEDMFNIGSELRFTASINTNTGIDTELFLLPQNAYNRVKYFANKTDKFYNIKIFHSFNSNYDEEISSTMSGLQLEYLYIHKNIESISFDNDYDEDIEINSFQEFYEYVSMFDTSELTNIELF